MDNKEKIVVFGFGRQGRKTIKGLLLAFDILAIVDNNSSKVGKYYNDIPIVDAISAKDLLVSNRVIVTAQPSFYKEIKKQLEEIGLVENENFFEAHAFIPAWFLEKRKQIFLFKLDMIVTTFCSLNCEKCDAFMPYFKNKRHCTLEELKKNVDLTFKRVDYLCQFNIIGGEPFLHKDLGKLLDYIYEKYNDKIGVICIITNGTIHPAPEMLDRLHKYNICISLSDYSSAVNYKDKVDALCAEFDKYEIEYMRNDNIQWYDLGFPQRIYYYSDEEVGEHMRKCNTLCQALYDGKIWYCAVSCFAYYAGLFNNIENDYIDLEEIDIEDIEKKKGILDICSGKVKNGFLEICKYCGGFGVDNDNEIPTAKQVPYNITLEPEIRKEN